MEEKQPITRVQKVSAEEMSAELMRISIFEGARAADLKCLGELELLEVPAGSVLVNPETADAQTERYFWILLEGEIRFEKQENDGSTIHLATLQSGETFGEVQLLARTKMVLVVPRLTQDSRLIRIEEESFWRMMANCPFTRSVILGNMARRLQSYQQQALHREKLVSLGTLAAGLMHELNNPGTAAKRAASQMRENLIRLQHLSLKFCDVEMTQAQTECMRALQEQALKFDKPRVVSTLEQADAEDELCEWLDQAGVENAWKLAPTLSAIGLTREQLICTQHEFPGPMLSDSLNWLDSLISSMQLVGTIEESIARVSELVMAVKKYSYEDKAVAHQVDVHDGIQSTLTILGHKFRQKELRIAKRFEAESPVITTSGVGLSQVWTNLLDNAIDAAPEKGILGIHTWNEDGNVCIGIEDNGAGIAEEHSDKIFEPFFTTKPAGHGTGLGLEIVHRIVTQKYKGEISFTSEPGKTEFVVKLPLQS